MYAIYKGKRYRAVKKGEKIRIGSDTKEYGFTEYVDVVGNVHYDRFVKLLDMDELDYLYEERFEIQYQGRFFKISSALRRINLDRDWFEIYVSLEEHQLGISLGFERTDKFLWSKEIGRKDIEAFKIIEMPQGPFSNQGIKVRILEGQEIDDYFASITD
ncbi:hypothetical protein ACVRZS_09400 [Streptococcus ferus]|uniref:Uncharacterized protein n=1 Tax=Streptococcus ferus TaxID=1345 RepID=A0A2X3VUP3_9STRE|nr:hypothetical protein [Streptococcus ferus]MCP3889295.1 hypothetical protein [Desulfobulbaceae bacterium]SQF38979.1 Uncharacterised protein [Streptococcus ferus]